MKIVIFTVDHIYANKVVKDVIAAFSTEIKLVVESETLLPKRTKFQALKRYLEISGFHYVFAQIIKLEIYKFLSILAGAFCLRGSKFYSYKVIAKKSRIKLATVRNINEKKFIKRIRNISPDLIISIYFNQIFSTGIITLPKKGVINIHPAYLPDYKGVSPVFWSLANSEKDTGVTVHFIDEGIDTGKIIEREKVKIEKYDTEDSLYWRLCKTGSPLLIGAIERLKAGSVKSMTNVGGRYFSLPTKEAVKRYRKSREFFTLADYIFE